MTTKITTLQFFKLSKKHLEKAICLSLALGLMLPATALAANPAQTVNGTIVNFGDNYEIADTGGSAILATMLLSLLQIL